MVTLYLLPLQYAFVRLRLILKKRIGNYLQVYVLVLQKRRVVGAKL